LSVFWSVRKYWWHSQAQDHGLFIGVTGCGNFVSQKPPTTGFAYIFHTVRKFTQFLGPITSFHSRPIPCTLAHSSSFASENRKSENSQRNVVVSVAVAQGEVGVAVIRPLLMFNHAKKNTCFQNLSHAWTLGWNSTVSINTMPLLINGRHVRYYSTR